MAVRVTKMEGAGCRVEDGGFGVELCHVCKVQAILPSDKGDTRVVHVPWNISGDTLPSRVYSIPSSFLLLLLLLFIVVILLQHYQNASITTCTRVIAGEWSRSTHTPTLIYTHTLVLPLVYLAHTNVI